MRHLLLLPTVLVVASCAGEADRLLSLQDLSPARGSARGGQTVRLSGAGFTNQTEVRIGGVRAKVLEATATTLSVVLPKGAAGLAPVQVSTGGTQAQLDGGFLYEKLPFTLVDAAEQRLPAWPLDGRRASVADLDGDADLDVFQAARTEGVWVFTNDGTGTLAGPLQVQPPAMADGGTTDVFSVLAEDLTGDGVVDLFLGATALGKSWLMVGDRLGDFTPSTSALPDLLGASQVATALDLERDGDVDLLITGSTLSKTGPPSLVLLLNDGRGGFRDVSERLPGGPLAATGVTVADLDADGDDDVFVSMDRDSNRLYLADGKGSFARAAPDSLPRLGEARAGLAAAADLDRDGTVDLYVPTATQDLVWLNDGRARFTDATRSFLGPESAVAVSATAVDLDLDGNVDLAVVERPGRLRLLRNDGKGRLFDYSSAAVGNEPNPPVSAVVPVDLDGDGVLELFVSREDTARASVFVMASTDADADMDGWPDAFEVCPQGKTAPRRAPFGCRSGADCQATTGCALKAFGGKAYLACPMNATWAVAKDLCVARGGRLATVDGAADNAQLSRWVTASTWLGLTDQVTEGQWRWAQTPATFLAWGPGQPDNASNEDCAALLPNGTWNDLPCSTPAAFLCEAARAQPVLDASACAASDGGAR